MNTAIQKITTLYVNQFMDMISERFTINKEELEELWKESQKIKPNKKTMKKKKVSSYTVFNRMERQKLKEEGSSLTFAEISKEIGQRWRLLSPEEKKTYVSEPDQPDPTPDGMLTPVLAQEESADLIIHSAGRIIEETIATEEENDEETIPFEDTSTIKSKGKKIRKKTDRPAKLDETQNALWDEFSPFTLQELRKQCENNNLKTSKFRKDMILSLITHRMALENGHLPMEDDED
jgi:hypothetical protein